MTSTVFGLYIFSSIGLRSKAFNPNDFKSKLDLMVPI